MLLQALFTIPEWILCPLERGEEHIVSTVLGLFLHTKQSVPLCHVSYLTKELGPDMCQPFLQKEKILLKMSSNWSSTRHYWIVTDVVGSRYSKESSSNSPLLPHPPPFLTPLCLDSWSLQLPFQHSHSIVDLPSSCFDTLISFSVPLTPWAMGTDPYYGMLSLHIFQDFLSFCLR